jgi:CO/xanthine dehydrogenase FAD-binding subunit
MKPAAFAFRAPRDLAGALAALAEFGEEARVLAGGQSLVPLMNLRMVRAAALVSINGCDDLDYIRIENGRLAVGARVRQAQAEESELVARECPLLAEALPHCGPQATRNRATICGSLAHADPVAELPAVAAALDAEFEIAGPHGPRRVPATSFFVSELATCMQPGEMLAGVRFERGIAGERCAFLEVSNRQHGFAVAGVALRLRLDDAGRCSFARVAMIGAGPIAARVKPAEDCLTGAVVDQAAIDAAVAAAKTIVRPPTDAHADADYRRHVLGVLLKRALWQALGRATPVARLSLSRRMARHWSGAPPA